MKELSEAFEDDEGVWLFRYSADKNPSGELHNAGAILSENIIHDTRIDFESQNVEYRGSAYTEANTRDALESVRERLMEKGWIFMPIHTFKRLK